MSAPDSILLNWLLLFPFIAAAVIAVFPRMLRFIPAHEREPALAAPAATGITAVGLSLLVCAATGAVISRAKGGYVFVDYLWTPDFFQFRLRLDALGLYALIAVMAALTLSALWAAMAGVRDHVRWAALAAAAGAFTGVILAADLVLLYIFWELAALALWAALAPPPAAGRRFLTWSHTGGLCLLVAFLGVAVVSRDTHIYTAGAGLLVPPLSSVKWIGLLLAIGLGFRLALAPVHFWLPGLCHATAGKWNLALLGTGILVAGYAAARLIFYLLPSYTAAAVAWLPITMGLATVAYAGARALLVDDICAGASHLLAAVGGQIALGIGLGMRGRPEGLAGAMALLAPLAVAAPLLAAGAGDAARRWSERPGGFATSPAGVAMIAAAWTLSGLPPLAGFWGQRAIAAAAWQAGSIGALLGALIAPALILAYGVKVAVTGLAGRRRPGAAPRAEREPEPAWLWWWVIGAAAVSLALGLSSSAWGAQMLRMARALVGG